MLNAECYLLLLPARCSRFGEFIARLPANQRWLVGCEPSQSDAEARHHGIAAKVHLWIVFVSWLMVALGDKVFGLLQAPLAIVVLDIWRPRQWRTPERLRAPS